MMTNIVREFDTPLNVDQVVPTREATSADGKVLVEDSVTHQAGEGITTGMAKSQETPDIFDNSPQAVVKPQTADQALVDEAGVPVDALPIPNAKTGTTQNLGATPIRTPVAPSLDALPDGSVDIPRS